MLLSSHTWWHNHRHPNRMVSLWRPETIPMSGFKPRDLADFSYATLRPVMVVSTLTPYLTMPTPTVLRMLHCPPRSRGRSLLVS